MELIAQGTQPDFRWRRKIPPGVWLQLGRTTPSFRVPWDDRISRSHASLKLVDGRLKIQKVEAAANPVFFNGSEAETFRLKPGEHFVIGNTTFTLTRDRAQATLDVRNPISEKSFSHEFLRGVAYRDADRRIDVLSQLPDVISSTINEQDLMNRLLNTLLAGIGTATTIGIIRQHGTTDKGESSSDQTRGDQTKRDQTRGGQTRGDQTRGDQTRGGQSSVEPTFGAVPIDVIHWDRRSPVSGDFQPSEKLIRGAMASGETVLHLWQPTREMKSEFTFDYENDWAFVCPIHSPATPGWGIYVTGSNRPGSSGKADSGELDLQGDIKFCELVGATLKNLLLVKQLERRQSSLRSFFSPIVLEAIAGSDPDEVLAPKQCLVSVLFCDLRGFSRTSEQMSDDLFELLDRVSGSLDVTTGKILKHGGVIGDFHGDSTMGFWGWPLSPVTATADPHHATANLDTAGRAIETALDIRSEFAAREQTDFQMGFGIATGVAVAGKIGTSDQVKVTVFGPVVNLASRMEGMTRWLRCPILIDRPTMEQLASETAVARFSVRRLGKFKPFGLTSVIEVFQVFDASDGLDDSTLSRFETGLAQFQAGDWVGALATLRKNLESDPASQFLIDFMFQHHQQPPSRWTGVIEMTSK